MEPRHEPRSPEDDTKPPLERPPASRVKAAERRLLELAEEIERSDARSSGSVAYLSRLSVQTSLPYRRPPCETWCRRSGALTVTIQAPPDIGLPYGRYPRLILAWIGAEAVRRRSRELDLGASYAGFADSLGIGSSGGTYGPHRRLRDQLRRLLATSITCTWRPEAADGRYTIEESEGYRVSARSVLWWDAERVGVGRVRLSEDYFRELLRHPVPLDWRVLVGLRSPVAMDLYAWISYRAYTLRRPVTISWTDLAGQLGTQARARRFRQTVCRALREVRSLYRSAKVDVSEDGVRLFPSRPHVVR